MSNTEQGKCGGNTFKLVSLLFLRLNCTCQVGYIRKRCKSWTPKISAETSETSSLKWFTVVTVFWRRCYWATLLFRRQEEHNICGACLCGLAIFQWLTVPPPPFPFLFPGSVAKDSRTATDRAGEYRHTHVFPQGIMFLRFRSPVKPTPTACVCKVILVCFKVKSEINH